MLIVLRQHRPPLLRFAVSPVRASINAFQPSLVGAVPSHKLSGRSAIAHGWHVNCRVVRREMSLHYTNIAA
jgi:hypothetical protein